METEIVKTEIVTINMAVRPDIPDDSRTLVASAVALNVIDDESFQIAAELASTCASRIATITDPGNDLSQARDAAHKSHKALVKVINGLVEPYERVRNMLTSKMHGYRIKQELERKAAEQKVQREAEAETRRLEQEARELKRLGEMKSAREVVQKIEEIQQAPFIPDAKPVVEGVTERRPWVAIIDDPLLLIQAVAKGEFALMHSVPKRGGGEESVPVLLVNPAVLSYYAKRLGDNFKVPGCHAERELSFSIKST